MMVPFTPRFLLVLAATCWAGAIAYGYSSGGDRLGPVMLGVWGSVGDHLGFAVLLGLAAVSAFLAGVTLALRGEGEHALVTGTVESPGAVAALEAGDDPAPAGRLTGPPAWCPWPFVSALGLVGLMVGMVTDWVVVVLAVAVLLVALGAWSQTALHASCGSRSRR